MLIPWQQANVIINVTQEKVLVRLTDYDLASIWHEPLIYMSDVTEHWRWLAPEMIRNSCVSLSVDVFAFAMLAVEVFTGNHPFPEIKNNIEVLLAILAGNRPARPTNIPDDVWELVEKCWNANLGARPKIGKVVEGLKHYAGKSIISRLF